MKRQLCILSMLIFMLIPDASAQLPAYRSPGYKGSVSYANMMLIWNGFDMSHGYIFDGHQYLGAGSGLYFVPDGISCPTAIHIYADYKVFFREDANTPTAGVKIGYMRSLQDGYMGAMEFEPAVGWSWPLGRTFGLTVELGAYTATIPVNFTEYGSFPLTILPRFSFSFEF